jgi:hypothetical protein
MFNTAHFLSNEQLYYRKLWISQALRVKESDQLHIYIQLLIPNSEWDKSFLTEEVIKFYHTRLIKEEGFSSIGYYKHEKIIDMNCQKEKYSNYLAVMNSTENLQVTSEYTMKIFWIDLTGYTLVSL